MSALDSLHQLRQLNTEKTKRPTREEEKQQCGFIFSGKKVEYVSIEKSFPKLGQDFTPYASLCQHASSQSRYFGGNRILSDRSSSVPACSHR